MAFKFGPARRGKGGFRRGNVPRKRTSSPAAPPQEPYVGYSDKDFDDIYLNSGSQKMADPSSLGKLPISGQEPVMHGLAEPPQLHDTYRQSPSNPIDAVPMDYPRFPQHDFTKPIISLLNQDQFLDAAKEFERWCTNGECSPSDFNYLLNLVSAANDILEKLIESGHSLREFVDANRKEEDYRTLALKEKCHAVESIFISCSVTKTRWSLSNYELDRIEDFCQKMFKGIDFLKEVLSPGNEHAILGNHRMAGYSQESCAPRTAKIRDSQDGQYAPSSSQFNNSLCSVLSIALNTYPNGATVSDLVHYCNRNNINVSKLEIECILQEYSNLFIQRDSDGDLWMFHGFTFLNRFAER